MLLVACWFTDERCGLQIFLAWSTVFHRYIPGFRGSVRSGRPNISVAKSVLAGSNYLKDGLWSKRRQTKTATSRHVKWMLNC